MIKIKLRTIIITCFVLAAAALLVFGGYKSYEKVTYRRDYQELVSYYSELYSLEESLIYAVIKTESGFKPDALSNDGARGLMQIMPETYDWVSTKITPSPDGFDDMYIPEENIRYCTFLLWYLIDEFHNYEDALSAYHAGRGAVKGWLNNNEYSSDGISLHTIPYTDTAHYVKKVMKNYKAYCRLANS